MGPFITMIVAIVLIFSGVWGTLLVRALLERSSRKLESRQEDPRIADLVEDNHLLGTRLERMEEELAFMRELQEPDAPLPLRPAEPTDS